MGNSKVIDDLNTELSTLNKKQLDEVLNFVYYLKIKKIRDVSQLYYWTKEWQKLEKEADKDKKEGRIIGDGTAEGLIEELHK